MANGTINRTQAPWDLLWENSTITSDFAAQTVPLNLANYSEVKIVFVMGYGGGDYIQYDTSLYFTDDPDHDPSTQMYTYARAGSTNYFRVRTATLHRNGIEFSAATENGSTKNNMNKPLRIYAR